LSGEEGEKVASSYEFLVRENVTLSSRADSVWVGRMPVGIGVLPEQAVRVRKE
jgi:hypothetical protein